MLISAIVAMSQNRAIGLNNALPWHLPADLRHFKEVTMGKSILMGRKTYESIGRPLPGRLNLVLTRDRDFIAPGCTIVHSIDEAMQAAQPSNELCVIGGAVLYEKMLPKVQRLYLTVIEHICEGDAFFPDLDLSEWNVCASEAHQPDEKNQYPYRFDVLERV